MEKENKKWTNKVKDSLDVVGEGGVAVIGSFITESLIGQILPGVTTAAYSYKQKRFEKNIEVFISEIKRREDELKKRLNQMEHQLRNQFTEKYIGYVMDYVLEEKQEEKIKFMVNGLVNLAEHESITEDFVLTYYDTLDTLRLVDIAILREKYNSESALPTKTYTDILDEFGLSYENYDSIREKLVRVGLFTTKRDEELDNLYNNVLSIQKFLEELNKGKVKRMERFKKITKRDSYRISKFGRDFVEFFLEQSEKSEMFI